MPRLAKELQALASSGLDGGYYAAPPRGTRRAASSVALTARKAKAHPVASKRPVDDDHEVPTCPPALKQAVAALVPAHRPILLRKRVKAESTALPPVDTVENPVRAALPAQERRVADAVADATAAAFTAYDRSAEAGKCAMQVCFRLAACAPALDATPLLLRPIVPAFPASGADAALRLSVSRTTLPPVALYARPDVACVLPRATAVCGPVPRFVQPDVVRPRAVQPAKCEPVVVPWVARAEFAGLACDGLDPMQLIIHAFVGANQACAALANAKLSFKDADGTESPATQAECNAISASLNRYVLLTRHLDEMFSGDEEPWAIEFVPPSTHLCGRASHLTRAAYLLEMALSLYVTYEGDQMRRFYGHLASPQPLARVAGIPSLAAQQRGYARMRDMASAMKHNALVCAAPIIEQCEFAAMPIHTDIWEHIVHLCDKETRVSLAQTCHGLAAVVGRSWNHMALRGLPATLPRRRIFEGKQFPRIKRLELHSSLCAYDLHLLTNDVPADVDTLALMSLDVLDTRTFPAMRPVNLFLSLKKPPKDLFADRLSSLVRTDRLQSIDGWSGVRITRVDEQERPGAHHFLLEDLDDKLDSGKHVLVASLLGLMHALVCDTRETAAIVLDMLATTRHMGPGADGWSLVSRLYFLSGATATGTMEASAVLPLQDADDVEQHVAGAQEDFLRLGCHRKTDSTLWQQKWFSALNTVPGFVDYMEQ